VSGECGIDWENWTPKDTAVLTFIRRGGEVLLIEKKRGLGAGKVNAPGGRLEAGESLEQAAVRETREEVGLTPRGLRPAGRLDFQFTDGYSLRCQVFTADGCAGIPTETDEAAPFWCRESDIPYGRMWADDRLWIPLMLEGRGFEAQFVFDGDLMLWHRLTLTRR
jgi:8-oxo-dGTP diphosphatase